MSRLTGAMMLVAFLVGCGDGVFRVTVLFPDEEARQRTQTVHIMVLVPAERSACDELLSGRAEPGSVGYEIEDRVTFAYPSGEGGRSLQDIGPGRRLFFAQVLDGANVVILLGCVDLVAGRGGEGEVTIVLTWKCRLTNGGVETCDGVDNDCDGGGGCQVVEDGTFCQTASGQAGYCSAGSCIPL